VFERNHTNLSDQSRPVDAVAGAISILIYSHSRGLTAQFFDRPLILIQKDMYKACSFKLTKGERSKLQQAVINLKLSGKVQQIIDSYFGVPIQ